MTHPPAPPHPNDPAGARRYVVLHHTGFGADHFDLMIESEPGGGDLLTWRTDFWPLAQAAPLTALARHRRAYLEYEGPLSGGRGEVRRVAAGRCWLRQAGAVVVVKFAGEPGEWSLGASARPEMPPAE